MTMRRDRRPLPLQLRTEILGLIQREDMRPGDRLPTEAVIAGRFGVGRTTAREALKLLEQDGVVDVRHGSGRYVSQVATLDRPITRLESVTEMMQAHGYPMTNRVIAAVERAAQPEEAALLEPAGDVSGLQVVQLERARIHGCEPLIYSIDVFPRRLIGAPVDDIEWSGSLLDLLEAGGSRVVSAVATLRAVRLPVAGQRAIGWRTREPWVLLRQRNIDELGRVVILSHDYYRGDRFTFNVFRRRD